MFDCKKINSIISNTKINDKYFNVSKGKDNSPILKVFAENCSFYINSKYNSEKEGINFAKEYYKPTKNLLLYGLGMGFHIKALSDMLTPEQRLHIVECNPSLIKIAFENTDISETLKKSNITFTPLTDFNNAIFTIQNLLKKEDITFICHEPSLRIIPDNFSELKDIFETFIVRRRSLTVHGTNLSDNQKINLTKGYKNGGKIFKDMFKDKPAIIVSAGPSLEINGHMLKKVKDRAKIISVGRAMRYLKSIGVKPDFTIISDPLETILNQLDPNEKEIPLLFLSTVHPNVEKYKGPKYILFEDLSDCIKTKEEKSFAINVGGSVATAALSFGKLLGCNPLILIGQDLCFHSNKMHSGEKDTFLTLKSSKIVKGIDGNEYPSATNLYEYLKWFRKFARKHPELRLINCTAKGAYIDGFEHKSLDEIFD